MPSTSWGQVEQELWLIYMNKMVKRSENRVGPRLNALILIIREGVQDHIADMHISV